MDASTELIRKIIAEHEQIIGPLAWEEARKVRGLTVDALNKKITIADRRPEVVMGELIAQYEHLFGRTSIEIAKEVTKRDSDGRLIFYIYDEKTGGKIEQICRAYGLTVLTQTDQSNDWIFYFADGFILEITKPTSAAQNILTHAIRSVKPTLCLYRKNQPPRDLVQIIRHYKNHYPLKTSSYATEDLGVCVEKFIQCHDVKSDLYESVPRIKFTLRLSSRMEKYIGWKSKKLNISKADFVRKIINKTCENDEIYLKKGSKSPKRLNGKV